MTRSPQTEANARDDEHEFRRAQVLAIVKLAGLRECPNTPNTVCGCAPGRCQQREADERESR